MVLAPAPALAKIRMLLADDRAAQELIARCRAAQAQASDEEILYFLELRCAALRRAPPVENWRASLLASVPRHFQGLTIELEKYRAERRH